MRKGGIIESVSAGLLLGLSFHTYIASRFLPFVVAVPLLFFLWVWWKNRSIVSFCAPCLIALFLFGALLAFLPLGLHFVEEPTDFFGRGGQVSIFSGENPLYEFAKSNALTLQMFFGRGDCNPRHNLACQPELHWPVAIFFAIGSMLAVCRIVRFLKARGVPENDAASSLIILAWFLFMLFPATLTREGLPHALRSLGLIPPVFLLAGWGASFTWEKVKYYLETLEENPRRVRNIFICEWVVFWASSRTTNESFNVLPRM